MTLSGSALRLWYQTGCFGAPPIDATSAYSPSCSTRMSGVLRSAPLLLPRVVRMMIGNPVSSSVFASRPPVRSYVSTWVLTHSQGLGAYSPSLCSLMPRPYRHSPRKRLGRFDENYVDALLFLGLVSVYLVGVVGVTLAGSLLGGSNAQTR